MKRRLALALLLLFLCGSCALPQPKEEQGFRVYCLKTPFLEQQPMALTYELRELEPDEPELSIRLLEAMRMTAEPGNVPLLKQDIRINKVNIYGLAAAVDFSAQGFESLEMSDKTLLVCAAAKTLIDAGLCAYVKVTADEQPQAPFYERYFTAGNMFCSDQPAAHDDARHAATPDAG